MSSFSEQSEMLGNVIARTLGSAFFNWVRSMSAFADTSFTNVVPVTAFGGAPDANPITNTSALLQAATQVQAAGGGTVYLPAGLYPIVFQNPAGTASPLRLLNFSNVLFKGDGQYASILFDPQTMLAVPQPAVAGKGNAGITFADCIKCGVQDLGIMGANLWSQARLTTGLTIETRKGVYFESVVNGCKDCYVKDAYVTAIEGEALFADGLSDNLRIWDNHLYRCQSNGINWGGGDGLSAYRNRIQDIGQSAFQVGGTSWMVAQNTATMSENPATPGLSWVTAADLLIVYNTLGGLVCDNILSGFRTLNSSVNGITVGYNNANDVADVIVTRNLIEKYIFAIGAGNHNAPIAISAAVGALRRFYVGDNTIVNCGGVTSGGAVRAGIKVSGGQAVGGCIGPNTIDNGTSGSLDVGVHFDSALNPANTIRLETQRIPAGAVSVSPYVLDVAAGDDARVLVGSKTWDPPNVNDGAMISTTVTVAGSRVGDGGTVTFTGTGFVAGLVFSATCTATDVVTVTLFNKSGGAVDLGSGTLTVHVERT
jgi:hypothetical protein